EVALREVDALRAGELTRRHRLPAAVDRGPEVASGEPPVLHLEPRAEDVRDAELARDRLDLVAGGRRDDGERVAATPVGLHERARLGVDRGRQRAREDALRELLELLLRDVAQPGGRGGDRSEERRVGKEW